MPLNALRVFLGLAPKELPKVVFVSLPLTANIEVKFDLSEKGQDQDFTTCQAVYIDNRLGTAPLVLVCEGTEMPIVCPSFSIGMFPVAALTKLAFSLQSAQSVTARLWLLNVPQPYFVYPVV